MKSRFRSINEKLQSMLVHPVRKTITNYKTDISCQSHFCSNFENNTFGKWLIFEFDIYSDLVFICCCYNSNVKMHSELATNLMLNEDPWMYLPFFIWAYVGLCRWYKTNQFLYSKTTKEKLLGKIRKKTPTTKTLSNRAQCVQCGGFMPILITRRCFLLELSRAEPSRDEHTYSVAF